MRSRGSELSEGNQLAGKVLRVARGILGAAAGVVVGFLLARVCVEALVYHPTGAFAHPQLGPTYETGIDVHGMEGFSWSRIGPDGFRVPMFNANVRRGGEAGASEVPVKPPLTVICIGDSYTEGFQIPYSATFPARLGATLSERMGTRVTGINAGKSGGSPPKYVAIADYITERYRPDAVVVQLNDGDFAELSNASRAYYATKTADGWVALPGNWSKDPAAVGASKLVTRADKIMGEGMSWVVDDMRLKRTTAAKDAAERTASSAPKPTITQKPRRVAPLTLSADQLAPVNWAIHSIAEAYDAPVVVVYLPQVHYPDISPQPEPLESAIASACAAEGMTFVSAREGFAARFAVDGSPSHGFANTQPGSGHINAVGHAVVADVLSEKLEAILRGDVSSEGVAP